MEDKRLETLLESYLMGETSTAEEQLLKQHFASPDAKIPDEFLYAKAMFGYFDAAAAESCPARPGKRTNPLLMVVRIAAPLAAAVLLALLLRPAYSEPAVYCYLNGEPIYDRGFAESQAELAISTLSSTLQLQNLAIDNILETLINK